MTNGLALIGGSGFIGRHLLRALANDRTGQVRVLVHAHDPCERLTAPNISTASGDLLKPGSLEALITTGCTVVNLAYMSARSRDDNLAAVTNLAKACRIGRARRMVHVSTAAVVGAASGDVITEATPPDPRVDYESTKLEIERRLTVEARNAFELVILRPTAVLGPGGKNLITLAAGLLGDTALKNYARACLHGRRKMNLVCVDNVVAAIRFATEVHVTSPSEIFIVSDDDDTLNNYRDVASILRRSLGRGDYAVPPLPISRTLLRMVLKFRGRSNANPNRVYSDARLTGAGFRKATTLAAGLASFGDWYLQAHARSADIVE